MLSADVAAVCAKARNRYSSCRSERVRTTENYSIAQPLSIFFNSVLMCTAQVLHELSQRCPNLTHLLLDFSHGAQLADFSGLSAFPTKIRYAMEVNFS